MHFFALILSMFFSSSAIADAVSVSIVEAGKGYQLLRGGAAYKIKGAGMASNDLESLARVGGNSIRTWHVEKDVAKGLAFLDKADALGITVSLCLNIARERHGFDYDDPLAVKMQFEKAHAAVEAYKNHPALLTWIIGNELNYDYKNPRVYDAVNDIARMIHAVDSNHPATTTIAGWSADLVKVIENRAPDLDFLSIQMYGDLINLPRYIKKANYRSPYFVTEWGSIGHWEVGKTSWGAPVEQNSSQKANNYLKSYKKVIASDPHYAIGNYVFLWGHKQERTATWYGMFIESGEKTETIDVMWKIWNGTKPVNSSPRVKSMHLVSQTAFNNITLKPGKSYKASVKAFDPDGDEITYHWSIKPESNATQHGGDLEDSIASLEGLFEKVNDAKVTFTTPVLKGPYRIYMYAYDGKGGAAHGNIPFFVGKR
jgi:hypothetical protein